MRRKIKGQSVLEYAVLVAAVVAGLISMQIYVKRGLSGRLRLGSDALSEAQYSPMHTVSGLSTLITVSTTEDSAGGLSSVHTDETRLRTSDTETITREE